MRTRVARSPPVSIHVPNTPNRTRLPLLPEFERAWQMQQQQQQHDRHHHHDHISPRSLMNGREMESANPDDFRWTYNEHGQLVLGIASEKQSSPPNQRPVPLLAEVLPRVGGLLTFPMPEVDATVLSEEFVRVAENAKERQRRQQVIRSRVRRDRETRQEQVAQTRINVNTTGQQQQVVASVQTRINVNTTGQQQQDSAVHLAPRNAPRYNDWEIADFSYESLLALDVNNVRHGLNQNQMSKLSRGCGQGSSSDDTCAICLDVVATAAPMNLPCGHTFHKRCICQWFVQHTACPVCRREFQTV